MLASHRMFEEPSELLARLRSRSKDPELRKRLGTWARSEGRGGGLASAWLARTDGLGPELLALALDAHVLGMLDRQREQDLARRKSLVPVSELRNATVVFLAGEQDVEVLDVVFPAAARRAIGQRSKGLVVEISSARQDETLAHALAALTRLGLPEAMELGVSGSSGADWSGRCRALCADPHRLRFWADLGAMLDAQGREKEPA